MSAINSQNLALAIVKLVAVEFLPALIGNLIMGNLVNRDFEATLANEGDTVNVPIPPVLSANNIAEGGNVTKQAGTPGNAAVVLNNHIEATFAVTDIAKALSSVDALRLYMQPAINALAERIETDLLAAYPLLTVNTAVGTGNTALTEAVIDDAETTLFKAKVPQAEPKLLVVSADAYSDVRQLSRFSEEQTSGQGQAILTGQIGRIKDFATFRSQYVAKPSTTTYNLAFTRNAFALAMRRLPAPPAGTGVIAEYAELGGFGMRVLMSYNPTSLDTQITVDSLYGVGLLRNNHGVQVLS
jgi:hypothetical protein